MKKYLLRGAVVLIVTLSMGAPAVTPAAEKIGPSAPGTGAGGGFGGADETHQGQVLKIEGDKYTMRDSAGNTVNFRVNEQTKIESTPQIGEKIEVIMTEGGQAKVIKKGGGSRPTENY
jgi:hypothetical protein